MTKPAKLPAGTLDAIRAAQDVAQTVEVPVEEWGVTVTVRGMTRGEIKGIAAAVSAAGEGESSDLYDVLTLSLGLVDPKVTEDEAAVILGEKGLRPVKKVMDAILEASGLSDGFRS